MLVSVVEQCPVCSSTRTGVFAGFPELVFSKCSECRTVFRSAEDKARLSFAYDEDYFTSDGKRSLGYDRRFDRRVEKASADILLALEAASGREGPVVDLGCSMGYVLEASGRLGIEATGIDTSEFAVEDCRRSGYSAEVGDIARTGLPDGGFGVAILKHILEHTPTPRESLLETARLLAPGGAVYIEMPHIGYWKAQAFPGSYKWFRPDWIGAQHYVYITPRRLRRLLEETGFERVRFGRARILHEALATGRQTRFAEARRLAGAGAVALAHSFAPWLQKTMVAVARKRSGESGS